MIIRSGRRPEVSHIVLPKQGSVAVDLGGAHMLEPVPTGLESVEVWPVKWTTEDEPHPTDFMMFTTKPEVNSCSFTYRDSYERVITDEQNAAEAAYRRQHDAPDDAIVERVEMPGTHLVEVTVRWWELVVS